MHSTQTIQRSPQPNLGLVLIFGSVITIALWYAALAWYSADAYPILLNPWYASETMMMATHYSVVFGLPLLGGGLGYLIARKIQMHLPALSDGVQSWLYMLSIFPCLVMFLFFLAITGFGAPNGIGVAVSYQDYTIRFSQHYGYDTFRTEALSLIITQEDGGRREQTLRYTWESYETITICSDIRTYEQGQRIYFLCNNEPITQQTAYIDTAKGTIYTGWEQCPGEIVLQEAFRTKDYWLCDSE